MEDKIGGKTTGDKIREITTIRKFKLVMLDLFRGYPAWKYFGIFEYHFGDELGKKIIGILKSDELLDINFNKEQNQDEYRLTGRGVDMAISMINLEHSEKILNYAQETHYFTKVLIWLTYIIALLTFGLFIFGFIQSLTTLWF